LKGIAVFVLIIGIYGLANAQDDKTKGLDVVSDTAVSIIRKTNAFFQGNLEWTMPTDKNNYKKDYTIDTLGARVPRSTIGKYDSGNR